MASYGVDIVLCIDITSSMSSMIEEVKTLALSFGDDVRAAAAEVGKDVTKLRVRVLGFRDFSADEVHSIVASEFFTLPDERDLFEEFVSNLDAVGGGGGPESGLEALALAIRSMWATSETFSRQVVVIWTDAAAHPLDKDAGSKPSCYLWSMPRDFDELTDWWEGDAFMDYRAKRLILFAPDAAGWSEIGSNWDSAVHLASTGGAGLSEHEYSVILRSIVFAV